MAKSVLNRKNIVSNAAYDLVTTLQQQGLTCMVVSEMAALLQGSTVVPKDVKIVILPSTDTTLSKDNVAKYLMSQYPSKFRSRVRKCKCDVLSYYDSNIQPPKKSYCDLELIFVADPLTSDYRVELMGEAEGLPVVSILCILQEKISELLAQYDAAKDKTEFVRRPPKKLSRYIRALLPTTTRSMYIPSDKSFRFEAQECFTRASSVFPEFAQGLAPLIRACHTGYIKSNVRLTYPNGAPLDVDHLLQTLEVIPTRTREALSESLTINTDLRTVSQNNVDCSKEVIQTSRLSPIALPFSPSKPIKATSEYRTEAICIVAKKIVNILRDGGIDCALFGSLACFLYGNERSPNDIDIIIFPPPGRLMTAEYLKQLIANGDPDHFVLDWGKNPQATYRVLYYAVDDGLAPENTFHKDKCKVDVLLPGTMHLPYLSQVDIKWKDGFPVIPFSLLLLQKLQGWDDHRRMPEPYKFEKSIMDAADVQRLLKLEHIVPLRFSMPWQNRLLFSEEFYNLSLRRVKQFSEFFPSSKEDWIRLGFDPSSHA